jgi:DNA-binding GntR family transcriptional regulator
MSSRGGKRPLRASDALVEQLRRKIITMELAPGAVVTEAELCAMLGCTRSPLREALQKLAGEHLVLAIPRRGVSIAELSFLDFSQLLEALDGVYRQIGRLAAVRITDAQLTEIDEMMVAARAADAGGDIALAADLDWRFHHLVGASVNNRFLLEALDTWGRLLMRFSYLGFRSAGTSAGALEDHGAIVAALRSRDPDTAEAAVADHLAHGRQRMLAGL